MKKQRWQDWTIVLLGVYLVLAPLFGIGAISGIAAINSYTVGTAVVIIALAAIARMEVWKEYTNMTFGLWLIVAPFALGFTDLVGPMWNQIIVGLVIGAVAYDATLNKTTPKSGHGGSEGHGHGHSHA